MKKKETRKSISAAEYYDTHGTLKDIVEEEIDLSLDEQLREAIIAVRRQNKGPLPKGTKVTSVVYERVI